MVEQKPFSAKSNSQPLTFLQTNDVILKRPVFASAFKSDISKRFNSFFPILSTSAATSHNTSRVCVKQPLPTRGTCLRDLAQRPRYTL